MSIKSTPLADEEINLDGKYALIIDSSYRMGKFKKDIADTLNWLNKTDYIVEIYTADKKYKKYISRFEKYQFVEKNNNLKIDDILFFGNSNLYTLLKEFQFFNKEKYAGIIVLTDQYTRQKNENNKQSLKYKVPIYLMHVDKLAAYYEDGLLETIQRSGGTVGLNIKDIFNKISYNHYIRKNRKNAHVVDGVLWEVVSEKTNQKYSDNRLKPLAAKIYTNIFLKFARLSLKKLDELHKIAKDNSIVTPYSSMIVLVNSQQKQELKDAEKDKDRFKRDTETGKEVLTKPNPFVVTGTPEPEEWILISIVLFMLFYIIGKRKGYDLLLKLNILKK